MVRDVAVEPQPTKPSVGQIEVDFLVQPPLRANAEAVAEDQHAHHQLGTYRGPPNVAVIGSEMRSQPGQIDETVDLAKQVIFGDVPLKAEAIKQRLLHHPPLADHRPNLLRPGERNQ